MVISRRLQPRLYFLMAANQHSYAAVCLHDQTVQWVAIERAAAAVNTAYLQQFQQ